MLRICGSLTSHYILPILCLSSFLYAPTFLFPACVMFSPFYSFPNYPRFLPSLCLSTRSALLSHLILPWKVKNSDLPLSTHSRPTNAQLLKLHLNLPVLLHFGNLVSKSLSNMSLSLLPEGTSHRFLAVKE